MSSFSRTGYGEVAGAASPRTWGFFLVVTYQVAASTATSAPEGDVGPGGEHACSLPFEASLAVAMIRRDQMLMFRRRLSRTRQ